MSRWMPTVRVMLAAMLLNGADTAAEAQVTAYLLTPPSYLCQSGCVGQIAAVDLNGGRVLWTAPLASAYGLQYGGVYTTPDGRFVVWQGASDVDLGDRVLGLFDVVTRQVTTVPLTKPSYSPLPPGLLGHPLRPEVYTVDVSGPIAVSPSGTRPLSCPTCNQRSAVSAISADGGRVMYATPTAVAVFDTGSGALVSEMALPPGSAALSRDGAEIYEVATPPGAATALRRYRVSDGQLLHEVAPVTAGTARVDPRSGDVSVVGTYQSLDVYAETTLVQRRSGFAPWYSQYSGGYRWTFDPNTTDVYVTAAYIVEPGTPYKRFVVFDASTFGLRLYLDQARPPGDDQGVFAPAPLPRAPGPLTATVLGSSVSLLWSPLAAPATTTHYVLEVGSAPGLSDIFSGLDVGLQTSFGASNVPPGAYYVRVRAGNYSGLGAPSNEVVVQVH